MKHLCIAPPFRSHSPVGWLVGLTCFYRRVVSVEVVAGTEFTGYGGSQYQTLRCHRHHHYYHSVFAFRWAAMFAILLFINCGGQSHGAVSRATRFEEKGEPHSGIEPGLVCFPAERLTTRPTLLTHYTLVPMVCLLA